MVKLSCASCAVSCRGGSLRLAERTRVDDRARRDVVTTSGFVRQGDLHIERLAEERCDRLPDVELKLHADHLAITIAEELIEQTDGRRRLYRLPAWLRLRSRDHGDGAGADVDDSDAPPPPEQAAAVAVAAPAKKKKSPTRRIVICCREDI
jgi:hypothetical protein